MFTGEIPEKAIAETSGHKSMMALRQYKNTSKEQMQVATGGVNIDARWGCSNTHTARWGYTLLLDVFFLTLDMALLTMLGVVIMTLDVVSLNTRLGVYYQIQLHFYSVLGVVIHVS